MSNCNGISPLKYLVNYKSLNTKYLKSHTKTSVKQNELLSNLLKRQTKSSSMFKNKNQDIQRTTYVSKILFNPK